MTDYLDSILGSYDDIPTDVRENMIDAHGLASDGEGRVFFEADYVTGDIDVERGLVLISMTGGPVTLGGGMTPDDVDSFIDQLVQSVTDLQFTQQVLARADEAFDEPDDAIDAGYVTRDAMEEAISGEELGLHPYLVLEGVWQYLDDTDQWATLAEWMTEQVDNDSQF